MYLRLQKNRIKKTTLAVLFFCSILLLGIAVVYPQQKTNETTNVKQTQKKDSLDSYYKELEVYTDALSIIKNEYVDVIKPNDLIYGSLRGLVSSLDTHSQFLDPQEYNEMKVDTTGKFGGLGTEVTVKDGLLTIVSVLEDSPAYKAGLKPNDRLVKINGEITESMTLGNCVKLLRGVPGSKVELTIFRDLENKVFDVSIIRDVIRIKSIKNVNMLDSSVGYIRIVEFQEMTAKELNKALKKLTRDGMKSLIIDVRNNPGGLLDVAAEVAELFLSEDKLIVYTKSRVSEQNIEFRSKPGKKYLDVPLVVLIDEGTASGAEILAGAIQDHKRGIILGKKSFGKGSVQTVIPLTDGSAIRLTTSKYFTPRGRSIHGLGIMPDIEIGAEKIIYPAKIKKHTLSKIEDATKKSVEYKITYDKQVARAVDLLKALAIYENLVVKKYESKKQ